MPLPIMHHMAKSTPPEAPPKPSWFERVFRPRLLLALALLASLPVLGPWAVRQLPVLEDRPEYQLPFSHIQLDPPPSDWIPADLAQRAGSNQLPDKVSLLDRSLPGELAAAFADHPWIEHVVSVRNQYPALVTVRVEYRQPVAVIRVKSGLYPVDGRGVLLPTADFSPMQVERLIPVHGIVTTPSVAEGRSWNDPAVLAAADLAMYLGSRWQELQLTAIFVSPAASDARADDISLEVEAAVGRGSCGAACRANTIRAN